MKIVLASASPRRRELMAMLGVQDLVVLPAKGEENCPEESGPGETVIALSAAKAAEVSALCAEEDLVIGADTIVWAEGRKLGKPHTEDEAREMLRLLSGKTHEVYTGVTVMKGENVISEYEVSEVTFRSLSEREIEAYVNSGDPMDKAGAYGIQGKAALFVRKIQGDYYNIMGLPLCRLGEMLKKQGVNLL